MSYFLETMHNSITVRQIWISILPTRLYNSHAISQEKNNELFNGLEYVRAYFDDLLIISNGKFEEHPNKVKIVFNKL